MEEARNLSTVLDLFTDFSGLQIISVRSACVVFRPPIVEGSNFENG